MMVTFCGWGHARTVMRTSCVVVAMMMAVASCSDDDTTGGGGSAAAGGVVGGGGTGGTSGGGTGGSGGSADVTKWHTYTVDFVGPESSETDESPNPFLDYRLQVLFTGPSSQTYDVAGYFAGDGDGGETGTVWRVHFTPDEAGPWQYVASFREGTEVAVSLDASAGQATSFDGQSGTFTVAPLDPAAAGFLKWGRLEYAGGHYLRFRDGGYWIRGGTDSPENLLAYADFDDTPASHSYQAHEQHWQPGDPTWGDERGKGLIGALNYLSSMQVNSIYFLPMNVGGDGQDVWPWADPDLDPSGAASNDNVHFDVSKLRQWGIVFDHAQRQGLFLHFVLNEAEAPNKRELDDGELGVERMLYYREIVARFGHHLALEWNLCEEYNIVFDFGADRIRDFADYLGAVDSYDHPIAVHSAGNPLTELGFTFGDDRFSMTSVQLGQQRIDTLVEQFREQTAGAGRPLPVSMDEFTVDLDQTPEWHPRDDPDRHRIEKLWPTYLSGGMVEYILEGTLSVDAFDDPDLALMWEYTGYARQFMLEQLPFWEMEPADELVSGEATVTVGMGSAGDFELGAQVFAKAGEIYAVYLPTASTTGSIDLSAAGGSLSQRWFNPRSGAFEGQAATVTGGSSVALGAPPSDPSLDWVVLIEP